MPEKTDVALGTAKAMSPKTLARLLMAVNSDLFRFSLIS